MQPFCVNFSLICVNRKYTSLKSAKLNLVVILKKRKFNIYYICAYEFLGGKHNGHANKKSSKG